MSEYYTVSQFANAFDKDTGNIRRLLIQGRIVGEKVGNQWLIPKSASYPVDRRKKDGAYCNWRKSTKLRSEHPKLMKKISAMCRELNQIYGDYMTEVILYGSYARGEESAESDVDIALVLRQSQTAEQRNKMTDIVVDCELDLGITISVITINRSEYLEWRNSLPFYKNIEKEGITLWKNM